MKKYNWKDKYCNGFAIVRLNDKFGFINEKGEEICEIKYDLCYDFKDEFAKVYMNDKYGYINNKGEEVIPCLYEHEESYNQLEKYKFNQMRKTKLDRIL